MSTNQAADRTYTVNIDVAYQLTASGTGSVYVMIIVGTACLGIAEGKGAVIIFGKSKGNIFAAGNKELIASVAQKCRIIKSY